MFDSAETLNIPYARKVLEHLIAHPEEHRQAHYGDRTACGTTACIAGTAIMMDPNCTIQWAINGLMAPPLIHGFEVDMDMHAAKLLGLTPNDATQLFYEWNNQRALKKLQAHIDEAERVQNHEQ